MTSLLPTPTFLQVGNLISNWYSRGWFIPPAKLGKGTWASNSPSREVCGSGEIVLGNNAATQQLEKKSD